MQNEVMAQHRDRPLYKCPFCDKNSKTLKSHSMSSGPEQCGRPSQILMKFGTVVGLLTL